MDTANLRKRRRKNCLGNKGSEHVIDIEVVFLKKKSKNELFYIIYTNWQIDFDNLGKYKYPKLESRTI